ARCASRRRLLVRGFGGLVLGGAVIGRRLDGLRLDLGGLDRIGRDGLALDGLRLYRHRVHVGGSTLALLAFLPAFRRVLREGDTRLHLALDLLAWRAGRSGVDAVEL